MLADAVIVDLVEQHGGSVLNRVCVCVIKRACVCVPFPLGDVNALGKVSLLTLRNQRSSVIDESRSSFTSPHVGYNKTQQPTKHQSVNRFDCWFLFSRQGAETPAAGKLVITAG